MINTSKFAKHYERATESMLTALASMAPAAWVDDARNNAAEAVIAASGFAETTMAQRLVDTIDMIAVHV